MIDICHGESLKLKNYSLSHKNKTKFSVHVPAHSLTLLNIISDPILSILPNHNIITGSLIHNITDGVWLQPETAAVRISIASNHAFYKRT